jgi:aminomethyltransferase
MELKKVPLNDVHLALGAKMVPFAGYNMPVRYSSDKDEHLSVRSAVGVFDVSHMGEFRLSGAKALDLIQLVTSNDASKLNDGQAQYSCLPNLDGGIVDDLLVYKMADHDYMLVVNASNIEKDWNWISRFNDMGVEMENLSDQTALLAVQGPKAQQILQKLTEINLSEIPYYHFRVGALASIQDVIISNTGYTGASGFELYVNSDQAKNLWDSVFEAGAEFGIKPIGLGARDTLRMEMGYCLYGNDIDDSTSPLEAGLGWITKFTKKFNNSDFLLRQKQEGISRNLVGFVAEGKAIPRSHYPICDSNGNKIGEVTSGTLSPSMNLGIGLGYVKSEYKTPGTEIFIEIRGQLQPAKIEKLPLLKN